MHPKQKTKQQETKRQTETSGLFCRKWDETYNKLKCFANDKAYL